MSRNQALEKVGRARVAYKLQQKGWRVGEAFDDGYDLLAHHPERNATCYIELKTMDSSNRGKDSNLTAPVSAKERDTCTHIIVYLEPEGRYFIARKNRILTPKGNIFAATNDKGVLRPSKENSYSFAKYENESIPLLVDNAKRPPMGLTPRSRGAEGVVRSRAAARRAGGAGVGSP